jgi:hypothetical protein
MKPILCLDFDGVLHSYSSGWKGADVIPDLPVDGAMRFIWEATEEFRVAIFSSRTNQPGGLAAMQEWLIAHLRQYSGVKVLADDKFAEIEWPTEKPAAFVTLDDRAITFEGVWPAIDELKDFKPWNKARRESDMSAIPAAVTKERVEVAACAAREVDWSASRRRNCARLSAPLSQPTTLCETRV